MEAKVEKPQEVITLQQLQAEYDKLIKEQNQIWTDKQNKFKEFEKAMADLNTKEKTVNDKIKAKIEQMEKYKNKKAKQ